MQSQTGVQTYSSWYKKCLTTKKNGGTNIHEDRTSLDGLYHRLLLLLQIIIIIIIIIRGNIR
jgi:hypothetical protein